MNIFTYLRLPVSLSFVGLPLVIRLSLVIELSLIVELSLVVRLSLVGLVLLPIWLVVVFVVLLLCWSGFMSDLGSPVRRQT